LRYLAHALRVFECTHMHLQYAQSDTLYGNAHVQATLRGSIEGFEANLRGRNTEVSCRPD